MRECRGEGCAFQRLCELGFVPGAEVRVVRYAPLGDPMEVEIHGYHLSLRRAEAAMVEVERTEARRAQTSPAAEAAVEAAGRRLEAACDAV